jgi:hypothetical protein
MADLNIKKVFITNDKLGAIGAGNTYLLRYRIVSEDKNRFSHWSSIYQISGDTVSHNNIGDLNIIGNTISVTWSDTKVRNSYDIFVAFDNSSSDPVYKSTVNNNTYSFLKTGTTNVKVIVQVGSMDKVIDPDLKIYDSGWESII